ncbi:hypothetical protein [Luethyella okanaganae]|uniref:Uncharacterized protein n=1 Tax=Luethyella okanaganae TaxID=69372 RepID=A0ABW1VCB3_9MICO
MFRRRRQNAPVVQTPVPELTNEQVFELLNGKLADLIGTHGQWTLVRRTSEDTDAIFHAMLTHQIAAELTRTVQAGRAVLRGEHGAEPAALAWAPAPIALWTDSEAPDVAAAAPALEATPIDAATAATDAPSADASSRLVA